MQDDALIHSAQQGNIQAFNELVLLYQDKVYTAVYRIMGESNAADDLTQETFLMAYRKLSQFYGGNFVGWLIRIGINLCYDELRRRKRHPSDSLEDFVGGEEANPHLASGQESPEQAAQRSELRSAIEECFSLLSEEYRLVVLMADVEDYSYEEIAEVTRISLGTVKSRISRGRARLRACLQGKGELLPASYRQET